MDPVIVQQRACEEEQRALVASELADGGDLGPGGVPGEIRSPGSRVDIDEGTQLGSGTPWTLTHGSRAGTPAASSGAVNCAPPSCLGRGVGRERSRKG